jgi:hypothetical protein
MQPTLANPLSGPELFNKHQKMDKLILKNQIGYHFKKVVREVSQELFVSRRIDVSTLFSGIYALKQTSQEVTRYCQILGDGIINSKGVFGSKNNIQELSNYVYIKYPETASFAEAKARCESRKMQLPEVYSMLQHEHLASFLRANKLRMCFAGLQPDVPDAIFRFISTGFPMWRTPHAKVYTTDQNALGVDALIDDFNAKFFYGDNNKMYARLAHPSILTDTNFTSTPKVLTPLEQREFDLRQRDLTNWLDTLSPNVSLPEPVMTRSGRISRPPERYSDDLEERRQTLLREHAEGTEYLRQQSKKSSSNRSSRRKSEPVASTSSKPSLGATQKVPSTVRSKSAKSDKASQKSKSSKR